MALITRLEEQWKIFEDESWAKGEPKHSYRRVLRVLVLDRRKMSSVCMLGWETISFEGRHW